MEHMIYTRETHPDTHTHTHTQASSEDAAPVFNDTHTHTHIHTDFHVFHRCNGFYSFSQLLWLNSRMKFFVFETISSDL